MADLADAVRERTHERTGVPDHVTRRTTWARDHLDVADPGPDPETGLPSKAALADAIRAAAPDAMVVNESNTSKYAVLTRWGFDPEQFLANKNGGLGFGLPMSVGAAEAMAETHADREAGNDSLPAPRPVVGVIGDGSYLYYPQTVYSAARYDLDLTVVVPDNRTYRILKDGMLSIYGGEDADYDYVGMDIEPPVDIAGTAENHGALGVFVDAGDDLDAAIQAAINVDGPAVVDALVHD